MNEQQSFTRTKAAAQPSPEIEQKDNSNDCKPIDRKGTKPKSKRKSQKEEQKQLSKQ
jgi:hypothetical protein